MSWGHVKMFIHIDIEIEFEESSTEHTYRDYYDLIKTLQSSTEHTYCDYYDLIKTLDGVKVDVIFEGLY